MPFQVINPALHVTDAAHCTLPSWVISATL